ncbi:hypothetical protein N665_0010s0031 [Sinapis alba]|nr:hypothetical protein N665_0010s0031 [Sinapis alba]
MKVVLEEKRRCFALTSEHIQKVENLLAVRSELADHLTVQPIDGWRLFVTGGIRNCIVDLEHGKCDCGIYAVEKIPCSHVIAAGNHDGLHISTLVSSFYSKDTLFAGYSQNIYPHAGIVKASKCLPPNVKRPLGRQKKSRWQSWLELSRMRGHKSMKQHRVYRCSNCKETGHTAPHCEN